MNKTTNNVKKQGFAVLNLNPFGQSVPPTFDSSLMKQNYFDSLPQMSMFNESDPADQVTKMQTLHLIRTTFTNTARLAVWNTVDSNNKMIAMALHNIYHSEELRFSTVTPEVMKSIRSIIEKWICNKYCYYGSKDNMPIEEMLTYRNIYREASVGIGLVSNISDRIFNIEYYLLTNPDNLEFDAMSYASDTFRFTISKINSAVYDPNMMDSLVFDPSDENIEEAYNALSNEISCICREVGGNFVQVLNSIWVYAAQLATTVDYTVGIEDLKSSIKNNNFELDPPYQY